MKLSDYVFSFLCEHGVTNCFMLPGGGAMHLVDSLGKSKMEYVCFLHEQGAACAAEAYGQHTNHPALLLVTSGPGVTNAITPVAAGWIDSTPMFVISGQAKCADLVGDTGVRQSGSQEVPTVPIVKPITKYSAEVMDPNKIRYYLERAWYECVFGRPGPVWLSIPLDIQGAQINENELEGFEPPKSVENGYEAAADACVKLLKQSKKPLFLAGNGIKLSGGENALYRLLEKLPIPVLTTWKSIDMFEEEHSLYMGHPGVMGDRGANLFLQEADLLISVGSRLDTSLTAYNEANFAKNAKKVVVDIDANEIARMKMQLDVSFIGDARHFLEVFTEVAREEEFQQNQWKEWLAYGKSLRKKYPVVTQKHKNFEAYVSAYYFIDRLCELITGQDIVVAESAGGAGEITYQAFRIKKGQKMKNAAGLGSMGFGLPYAIGSCIANQRRRTILINGDGSFQLNIQELETLKRLNLPIKMFLWCNGGYASIRNMQTNNFGRLVASSKESGYTVPDGAKVAKAYGFRTFRIKNNAELDKVLPCVLDSNDACFCAVFTDPSETVSPRVKSFSQPDGSMKSGVLENMWPEL